MYLISISIGVKSGISGIQEVVVTNHTIHKILKNLKF